MKSTDIKVCFVIMPFGDPQDLNNPWTEIYADQIKPAVEFCGLRCVRADEILKPGSIVEQIVDNLSYSFIVIAELTKKIQMFFMNLELDMLYPIELF